MHIAKWKEAIWKATYFVIPTLWHSGNGKTLETLNILVIAESEIEERGMNTQHREFSRQWKYF